MSVIEIFVSYGQGRVRFAMHDYEEGSYGYSRGDVNTDRQWLPVLFEDADACINAMFTQAKELALTFEMKP